MLGTYFWVLLALRKWKGKLRNGHLEPRVIITPFCNYFGNLWPAKCPLPVLVCPQILGAVPHLPAQASFPVLSGFCLLGITQPLGYVYLQGYILPFEPYQLLLKALNFC